MWPLRIPSVVRAVLVAGLEQELEPEADPEEGPAGGKPGGDRLGEAMAVEASHRRFRRADAGHDERIGAAECLAVAADRDIGTDGRERLVDADEVAGAVVDDGDAGRALVMRACPSSTQRPSAWDPARRRPARRDRAP